MQKLFQLHIFQLEHIPRSLPKNGNATTCPINAVQSLVLVLGGVTFEQRRRKKTGRQQLAAINAVNLLKKKIVSTDISLFNLYL
jgi:hypothetical protein